MDLKQLAPGRLGQTLETVSVAGARLNRAVYPAGLTTPEHVHPLPNLCLTLRGRYQERWGGRTEEFDPSSILVKPPGVEHVNRFGPTDVLCINIEFSMESWRELGGGLFHSPSRLVDPRLQRLGRELSHELTSPDRCTPLSAQGLVLSLAAAALRAEDRCVDRGPDRWLGAVRDRLHAEFASGLRLDDLAAEVGVHSAYLSRRFRQRFGCSVGDYVRRLRVEAALRGLEDHNRSLADVAIDCGFSDQSHMGRVLRQETGMSPGAWRRARS